MLNDEDTCNEIQMKRNLRELIQAAQNENELQKIICFLGRMDVYFTLMICIYSTLIHINLTYPINEIQYDDFKNYFYASNSVFAFPMQPWESFEVHCTAY